jgi:hypothetical protein
MILSLSGTLFLLTDKGVRILCKEFKKYKCKKMDKKGPLRIQALTAGFAGTAYCEGRGKPGCRTYWPGCNRQLLDTGLAGSFGRECH